MDEFVEWLTPASIVIGFVLSAIAWRSSEASKEARQEERMKSVMRSTQRLAAAIEKLSSAVDHLRGEHAQTRERLSLVEQEIKRHINGKGHS